MNYRVEDKLISMCLTLFIFSFGILFVVFFTPFYHLCIELFNIEQNTILTLEQIKINYKCMIDYFYLFNRSSLEFVNLTMSNSGRIHFEDVKVIVDIIQLVFIVSGLISGFTIIKQIKKQEYRYFKLTSKLVLYIPTILLFVCMIDFDASFVIFHKLLFRNNYWVFNVISDPVISILPQNFFMSAFVFIIIVVLSLAYICNLLYKIKYKEFIRYD